MRARCGTPYTARRESLYARHSHIQLTTRVSDRNASDVSRKPSLAQHDQRPRTVRADAQITIPEQLRGCFGLRQPAHAAPPANRGEPCVASSSMASECARDVSVTSRHSTRVTVLHLGATSPAHINKNTFKAAAGSGRAGAGSSAAHAETCSWRASYRSSCRCRASYDYCGRGSRPLGFEGLE